MVKSSSVPTTLLIYPTRLYSLHPTFYSDLRCMQTHPTVKCSAETVGSRDPTPLRDVRCCRNVGNNNPAPLHAKTHRVVAKNCKYLGNHELTRQREHYEMKEK